MQNNHTAEIIVHIDETLGDERREDLLRGLQTNKGVESAHFTPGRPHLLLVDYDAANIHSWDVLGYVRKEYVNAELIGGL